MRCVFSLDAMRSGILLFDEQNRPQHYGWFAVRANRVRDNLQRLDQVATALWVAHPIARIRR